MADAQSQSDREIEATWQELESTCAGIITLSQAVADHLRDGAPAFRIVKLLKRQARLTSRLHVGLSDAGPEFAAAAKTHGAHLTTQMKTLIEHDAANYQALSQRGVKLSGPRRPAAATNTTRRDAARPRP